MSTTPPLPPGSTPLTGLPTATVPQNILDAANSVLKQAQNAAHAALAILAALVLGVQGVVGTIHQISPTTNTMGADWRLVLISGGILTASKAVDSASWTSILNGFTGGK
jgi:hypothetical protein